MSFAAAAGAPASTTLHTDTEGLVHGEFSLPVHDGTQDAYYAAPQGVQGAPVVLVVQEIFGLHEHIRDLCRRLAKAGYFAVSSNLYQRQGDASKYHDIPTLVTEIVSKVSDEQVYADLDAAVAWARAQGADVSRLGVTGFCWGGRATWMYAAHNPQVKAAVAWYGKLSSGHGPLIKAVPLDIAGQVHAPVLGLYGGQDSSIPLADVEAMQARLAEGNAAARASRFVVYPDAGHAFLADYRPSYVAADARDGWARMLEWFERYLKA
ncbi:dienelactone hydrolase family protein [Bordetella trematum]|uniref:dienelactone hydrolase family protein n=1 Tax=Bordetella trematum TaxID=123899 RepID=UPI000D82C49E|nr:dienelactone hydrolase family protein [Bordetella trematum]SPU53837.1 carboxymethylenebutenolidase [Bordetella trematum]VDH06328.1 Carboxymethylenebutenolidase [Bordetella trematum]